MPFVQPSPSDPFSPGKVFTFLFVMIGPLEVIGPFAKLTAGWAVVALGVQAIVEALSFSVSAP